jgi:hypothetical protein
MQVCTLIAIGLGSLSVTAAAEAQRENNSHERSATPAESR